MAIIIQVRDKHVDVDCGIRGINVSVTVDPSICEGYFAGVFTPDALVDRLEEILRLGTLQAIDELMAESVHWRDDFPQLRKLLAERAKSDALRRMRVKRGRRRAIHARAVAEDAKSGLNERAIARKRNVDERTIRRRLREHDMSFKKLTRLIETKKADKNRI